MTLNSFDELRVPTRLGDFENETFSNKSNGKMLLKDIFLSSTPKKKRKISENVIKDDENYKFPAIKGQKQGSTTNNSQYSKNKAKMARKISKLE